MSTLTTQFLISFVGEKLGEELLKEILNFCKKNLKKEFLYRDKKEVKRFDVYSILLTLFKDLEGIGYNILLTQVKNTFHVSKESLLHNCKTIRKTIAKWAKPYLTIPPLKQLKKYCKTIDLTSVPTIEKTGLTKVHVWMDSTDFAMTGKRSMVKTDPFWSFKENSPGRQFMCAADGSGTIIKLWGLYSPKLKDGDFLKLKKEELQQDFGACTVVADGHFEWGRKQDNIKGI